MKIIILVLFLFICANNLFAQINLVKNPSFEDYYHCPHYVGEVTYAKYWTGIVDTGWGGSVSIDSFYSSTTALDCFATYCNACDDNFADPTRNATIPYNIYCAFNHYPRTGNGLMCARIYYDGSGGYTGTDGLYHYLQGRLYHPLVAGQSYCVTFYVCMPWGSVYALNHIGAYLDNGMIDTGTISICGYPKTMYTPQIVESSVISDTANWT